MLLNFIFAVLAFIVIGAFAAQMKRRRDYENSENDENPEF
jgi:hypothetical protein